MPSLSTRIAVLRMLNDRLLEIIMAGHVAGIFHQQTLFTNTSQPIPPTNLALENLKASTKLLSRFLPSIDRQLLMG